MTIQELKEYIYKNDKIEYVLESLGCHHISKHNSGDKSYVSGAYPDGDNPMGVVISDNGYLSYISYSRNITNDDKKDLISLVEQLKGYDFIGALKYLHNLLGLDFNKIKKAEPKKQHHDLLSVFTRYKRRKHYVNAEDMLALDEDVINDYVPILHKSWWDYGITEKTRMKFGIAYSYKRNRIIIPMRSWSNGRLLGFNARTTIDGYESLGIKKYFITPTYQKSLNIYGLWENYESIKKAGYVVVYESEKSVLRRDSLGDSTGVAISGHTLSDEQIRILIGLNVDIVISMDKDISIEEIRYMCDSFYGVRNVYYTWDKYGLIKEHDSIADAKNKTFEFLMKYKVKYDSKERKKYLEGLGRK